MDPQRALAAATIHPIYQRSVVQILGRRDIEVPPGQPPQYEKRFIGSGFIIHRKVHENRLLVITCKHVVDDKQIDETLVLRLPGTTEDVVTNQHESHKYFDLQVVSVHVPPEHPVDQLFPCVGFSSEPAPVGTSVAMIGYYNPINLSIYLDLDGPLFSIEPSAYGGYIVGPEDHTKSSGIVVQHDCYGIRGASGGPLISVDTHRALGVFTSLTETIGEAASTESVRLFLGKWLKTNKIRFNVNDTIQERIDRCAALY